MILLVHPNKNKITDFIMWADVEFAMQLELLETRKFDTQACSIIDLRELSALATVSSGEPLFVICHGGPDYPKTSLDGCEIHWTTLGIHIGLKLAFAANSIVLFACYAAHGTIGSRPIDLFVKGLRTVKRAGLSVTGYKGSTVTNTIGTVTARERPGGAGHGAFLVIDADPRNEKIVDFVDANMRRTLIPQETFNSYLKSVPQATARQKAINAAQLAEKFYAAFSTAFMSEGLYYPVGDNLGLPVVVTS